MWKLPEATILNIWCGNSLKRGKLSENFTHECFSFYRFVQSFCAFERRHTIAGWFVFHNWMCLDWGQCLMYTNCVVFEKDKSAHATEIDLRRFGLKVFSIFDLCDFHLWFWLWVPVVFDRHYTYMYIVHICSVRILKKWLFVRSWWQSIINGKKCSRNETTSHKFAGMCIYFWIKLFVSR